MPKDANGLWYPDLWGKQVEVFNSNARAMLLSGPSLSGKCLSFDTIIQCDGKLVRIGAIEPELLEGVSTEKSNTLVSFDIDTQKFLYCQSSHIYHDPCKSGLSVVTNSGYKLSASVWHPVWSFCDGRFSFRTTTEIRSLIEQGKKVHLPIRKGFEGWTEFQYVTVTFKSINRNIVKWASIHEKIESKLRRSNKSFKNVNTMAVAGNTNWKTMRSFLKKRITVPSFKVTINEDIAYLLGLLVGDGTITKLAVEKNSLGFSTHDSEFIESLSMTLSRYFSDSYIRRNGSTIDWYIRSQKLSALLSHLGMAGLAHEKHIPDAILNSPKSVVKAFIQGLFDTDGCALKNGFVEYCSASDSLAHDVQQILLAFGIRSSIKFRPNYRRGAWHLYIWGDAEIFYDLIGFRLSRKQNRRSLLHGRKISMERSDYPFEIKAVLKRLYLSRHDRGAIRGNLPRSAKHSEFENSHTRGEISTRKLSRFIDFTVSHDDKELASYYMDGKVFWESVKSVTDCSVDLFDFVVPQHHNFVGNGFVNHNTHAVLHKIVRHMWENPGARVAMFSKTIKNAKDGGTWKILHSKTIPEWINAGIGFDYTTLDANKVPGFKVDGQTRTAYFRIRNCHGGESECLLFSLDHDDDIEDKIKEQEFSMIYFSELDKFRDRKVLSISLPRLRMSHLKMEQQQWIADTNPSDEGESSWIYRVWFRERVMSYEEYLVYMKEEIHATPLSETSFTHFKQSLELYEFLPKENPRIDPRQLDELEFIYSYDHGLYSRYVLGKWIYGDGDSSRHFRKYFTARHAVGHCEGSEEDWAYGNPSSNSFELVTGWDLGETNHAAVLMDKVMDNNRPCFTIVDELVSLGEEVSIEDFTGSFMELIEALEQIPDPITGKSREYLLDRSWSDRSSIEKYSATADTYPYLQVNEASKGRIFLRGVPKPTSSVRMRVQLVKQLLAQNRLKVSAHCKFTIQMFKDLKRGKHALNYVVSDENKHIFDAISYALLMECAEELLSSSNQAQRRLGGICVQV